MRGIKALTTSCIGAAESTWQINVQVNTYKREDNDEHQDLSGSTGP